MALSRSTANSQVIRRGWRQKIKRDETSCTVLCIKIKRQPIKSKQYVPLRWFEECSTESKVFVGPASHAIPLAPYAVVESVSHMFFESIHCMLLLNRCIVERSACGASPSAPPRKTYSQVIYLNETTIVHGRTHKRCGNRYNDCSPPSTGGERRGNAHSNPVVGIDRLVKRFTSVTWDIPIRRKLQ